MSKKSRISPKGLKGRSISDTSKKNRYLFPFLILVFTWILYGNTLSHSYALDDDFVSKGNAFVMQGFGGIPSIFSKGFFYGFNGHNDQAYRPVSLFTTAVEVGIRGENPQTHHFFNVLYYAVSCMLLFFLLKRLFKAYPAWVPFVMVLFFTAHPVHTEDVANFKSRDEVLNFLFLVGLLLTLFRYIDTHKKVFFGSSLLFFFLALLTKELAITFLALVPLVLWFFSETSPKRVLFILIPYLAIAGIYLAMRWAILDSVTFSDKLTVLNNGLVAAPGISARLATAVLIMGKYLLLLFFPHPLSFDYSYNQIPLVPFSNPWVIFTLAVFIALAVYSVAGLRSKNIHSFSFLFFLITMSVVSNIFILIGTILGERFLLVPSLAFSISIVFILGKITRTDLRKITLKKSPLFISLFGLILILYSGKTISRNADWKDNLTLFEADIKTVPNSTRAQALLGYEYFTRLQSVPEARDKIEYYNKAKACFEKSIQIYPQNNYALYNYGVMEYTFGKLAESEILYRKAAEADSNDFNSWNNLCVVAVQLNKYDSALRYYSKLIYFKPDDANILSDMGVICERKKDYPKAIKYYKKSLAVDPARQATYNNIIGLMEFLGDTAGARQYSSQRPVN